MRRRPKTLQAKAFKFVLIDCDLDFGESFLLTATEQGYYVDCYRSMLEVGYLGRFLQYDAVIVNDELGDMSGLELGEYCDKLLGNLPVILISEHAPAMASGREQSWPRSIFRRLSKSLGSEAILEAAQAAAEHHAENGITDVLSNPALGPGLSRGG